MGRALKSVISLCALANELGLAFVDNSATVIQRVDAADTAQSGSLCFAKNEYWVDRADNNAILITTEELAKKRQNGIHLISANARLDYARALTILERLVGFVWSIDEPVIHHTVKIGKNVVIGKGVIIGADTVIYNNVVIGDEVIIGERCVIKSSAVIGEEGFGFERDSHGKAVRLPHIGTVVIRNDVEIGSLTTICRGTLTNTILRDGCKIDDHVHIAHNVDVGEDAFVIACAEVSGGVKIGNRAWIAPNASIMNQVSIGKDSIVGLGGVLTKSIADGITVIGNPAKPLNRNK